MSKYYTTSRVPVICGASINGTLVDEARRAHAICDSSFVYTWSKMYNLGYCNSTFEINEYGNSRMWSYGTPICVWDNDRRTLYVNSKWLYHGSTTTYSHIRKYVYTLLGEYITISNLREVDNKNELIGTFYVNSDSFWDSWDYYSKLYR
jgi:hypothetical protein